MLIACEASVIAIIDDEELVRESVQRLLKMAGYPVVAFASAEEFLKSSRLEEFRCVIADIRMPGMSGLDLQSRLNAEDYQIPIIFITAHGDEKMRVRAMRDGAVAFLAKPFDNSVLLDRVRVCLKGTQDGD
jgi:FixJ family two-component response regulator